MQKQKQGEDKLKGMMEMLEKAKKVLEYKKLFKEQLKEKKQEKMIELNNLLIQSEKIGDKYEASCNEIQRVKQEIQNEKQKKLIIQTKKCEDLQRGQKIKQQLYSRLEIQQQLLQDLKIQCQEKQNQIEHFETQTQLNLNRTLDLKRRNASNRIYIAEKEAIIKEKTKTIEEKFYQKIKGNNDYQQKRGNIRVYCRIRPFLPHQECQPIHQVISDNILKINVPGKHKSENAIKFQEFNFDQIFDQTQTQQNIFEQLVQLIHTAVDGRNVCIFAYGQTGSGKTFTMQGEDGAYDYNLGIIPRSIRWVFQLVEKAKSLNWVYTIMVQIKEIYLENVINLLNPETKGQKQSQKLIVSCEKQVLVVLQAAQKERKKAGTNCNERSSRSHLIFSIQLYAKNTQTFKEKRGSLNLVDLAGTERVQQSKVEGQRLKETQFINTSLSALGDVMNALVKKQTHIPYRNSKLTYQLQSSLSGDSKTLMFVNISPRSEDYNQTITSLRFAEKVKSCKINNR